LSAGVVDCKTRVWMSFSMQEGFQIAWNNDQYSRVPSLYMQLSHAAELYGVNGLDQIVDAS